MINYSLKIIDIRKETNDTVTVVFKQPSLKKIKYKAGQYLTLIFRINGRKYSRPYSFSSAPIVDANLEVTIKRITGGIVSNHIIDKLKIGEIVEVMEPMGDFILDEEEVLRETRIVLWGSGSGITPLMSIAKFALNQNIAKHITLIYGNRNHETVIFAEKIEKLKESFPERFSIFNFLTKPTISSDFSHIKHGRIDPAMVLKDLDKDDLLNNTIHYICGPYGLKESVKACLTDLGIKNHKVFSEDFEVTRNLADFENIVTRVVLVSIEGQQKKVEVTKGKSILEAALDASIDMPYSCQTGSCLICRGRLHKGLLKTIGVTKSPIGLQENEHLLCSSFPLTDDVEIEVYK